MVRKLMVVGAVVAAPALALAQTTPDATEIATGAQTAFNVIAPITIAIAGFFVIVKVAKRVVK